MENKYEAFNTALSKYDKPQCVKITMEFLSIPEPDIVGFYETVLRPALTSIASNDVIQEIPIWDEHLRSAIIRSVIELCYPVVLQEAQASNGRKAAVFCTEDETHEIGARMVADYLTLLGFDAIFIGASTPITSILDAIHWLKPDIVAISVTNYYHLVALSSLIQQIREHSDINTKIVIGGYAIDTLKDTRTFGADFISRTYDDLKKVKEAIQ